MNNKILVILVIFLISSVFLCGCNDDEESLNIDLIDKKIITKNLRGEKIGDGFITDTIPPDYEAPGSYNITVTINNNDSKEIDEITITANFYDDNNEYLFDHKITRHNIPANEDYIFSIEIESGPLYLQKFYEVNSVEFDFS